MLGLKGVSLPRVRVTMLLFGTGVSNIVFEHNGVEFNASSPTTDAYFNHRPLIIDEGVDISISIEEEDLIHGLFVPKPVGMEIISWDFDLYGPFLTPEDKIYVPIYSSEDLRINGSLNNISPKIRVLPLPSGITLTAQNIGGKVSGYLVDEDYFADCSRGLNRRILYVFFNY